MDKHKIIVGRIFKYFIYFVLFFYIFIFSMMGTIGGEMKYQAITLGLLLLFLLRKVIKRLIVGLAKKIHM